MLIEGIDFGEGADLTGVIRRRMSGQIHVQDDPTDPTLHAWLGRAYKSLRAAGAHLPLGQAFASLIADEDPLVREAAVWFLRAWPDDPAACAAARTALTRHRALYAGRPDTFDGSPAGLEGTLLGAVGKTIEGPDDPLLEMLAQAAARPEMLGPCLPALATHDPLFLVREAADLARTNAYWIGTWLAVLDKDQVPTPTRWIAPRSDIVARIARSSAVPSQRLREAIDTGVREPRERDALGVIAAEPGRIGDYSTEAIPPLGLAELRARCLSPGGANGALLTALGAQDPGFAARKLGTVLKATPGALGPFLAWSSRRGLDQAQTTRRVRGLDLYSRHLFFAVARVCIDRTKMATVEQAWPES